MLKAIMIVIVAVSLSAAPMEHSVTLSGVTKDCSPDQEFLVSNIDVFAFEPAANQHMVDLLRSMDTVSFDEDLSDAIDRFSAAYWQLDSMLTGSATLAKAVTSSDGAFSLNIPSIDSVLVVAHTAMEDEPFYYSYAMVRARADTAFILDMRRGQCGFANAPSSDATLPDDVIISGIATDCVGSEVYPIDSLGIWAFDPITDQDVVKVLMSIGITDLGTDSGVARFNTDYLKLQQLLAMSTVLARDTTTATGAFSLTVPPRDSVLVLGFTEPEDDIYYLRWQIVGGRSNSVLNLDMSAGECFPAGAARPASRVIARAPWQDHGS